MMARSTMRGALLPALAGLLLLIAPGSAAAQAGGTVTGKVKDTETGEPLAGARIGVVGSFAAATTRADGSYRLAIPAGNQELRVSAIGYSTGRASVTVTAGGSATQDFALSRAAVALEE